jgi:hypothetical protein
MESNSNLRAPSQAGVRNKIGMITGFMLGVAGFLILFKIIILDNTSPQDELAPGVVVLASLINGVLFALAARALQRYLKSRTHTKAK